MPDSNSTGGEENSRCVASASVIIPVHNKSTITAHCLDALLAEGPDGIDREIIVVDDGSSDRTPQVLAEYGDRIRVLRNDSALGFAGACNAGVLAASHELFVLLNNDTLPTENWLTALVVHALQHPEAAVVGSKLLFPNETIQHAGVVFGLDKRPHHIYAGFPASHPATATSRRFQVVTGACALFRRDVWDELGGLDTTYRNGWEDVDFCLRAGESGYEVHYCAESTLYHFESATRDLLSDVEKANQEIFRTRWEEKIVPDDFGYYWLDGLFSAKYGARYPIRLSVSPLLAGFSEMANDRVADSILYDRARQVMILLRNNIVLNVRVDEAEARAADAERRLADALQKLARLESSLEATADLQAESTEPDHASVDPAESKAPEATAAPPLPHRIVGTVESPGRHPEVVTDGVLIVTGWALTETGSATVEAIINGELRGMVEYGEPRLDAAMLYPGFPAGMNCGFTGEISVADLPDGFHTATIRISASSTEQAEITTTFEIDNHAFETGRVIGRLDLPIRGTLFIPRELVSVSGWAMAPPGIASIEVFIDGERRGRVDHGALRPDIGKRRKQYPSADHSGFSGTIPMHGLGPGNHEMIVRITSVDGKVLELPNRIEVDSAQTVDGGVPVLNRHYQTWLQRYASRQPMQNGSHETATILPDVHVIVHVEGDAKDELEALISSIDAQTRDGWRVTYVLADDVPDSLKSELGQLIEDDSRQSTVPAAGGSMADAVNEVIASSPLPWIIVLRPGVILAPRAFDAFAIAAANSPEAVAIYTDEDHIDPKTESRWNPFFKPDWSPDLLLAMSYLGPLVGFARGAAIEVGSLRVEAGDAAITDLVLRIHEAGGEIVHLPEVLVTTIGEAPAVDEPWHVGQWSEDERQVRSDAIGRRGEPGHVGHGLHPGLWHIQYRVEPPPSVTAIIPTGGKLHLLQPCLEDLIHNTSYPNLDILIVDNSGGEPVAGLVAELSSSRRPIRRITDERKPFNYSALINAAIPHTNAPLLLMLNDDITVIDPDWLQAMVEQAQRRGVGVVGSRLLYPDDTIQHAGVVLGPFGGSIHVFKRLPGSEPGYFDLPNVVRNVSAVTFACALIDREVFEKIGGLDEVNLPVAFNDTDFCLRAREAGYEVIYTPHATLYHHESVTKTVIAHHSEIKYLRDRWGHVIAHDPYYNPNLTRTGEDARLNMEAVSAP